eukprot:3055817-Pleurochrysis_carterae.AAC.1
MVTCAPVRVMRSISTGLSGFWSSVSATGTTLPLTRRPARYEREHTVQEAANEAAAEAVEASDCGRCF